VVGFDTRGIHKLRNGLEIETVPWTNVTAVRIGRGMDYNNWWIMLLLGVPMVGFALWLMFSALKVYGNDGATEGWYLEGNFLALTIGGLGALLVVLSLRRTVVLEFATIKGRSYSYSLRELVKRDHIHALAGYVQYNLPRGAKFEFEK
jgi:hypothetical protein